VAGKADVTVHLNSRRAVLQSLFSDWDTDLGADERADLVQAYFKEASLGQTQRVGSGHSIYVAPTSESAGRAAVLVIGRHDVDDLRAGVTGAGVTGATANASLVGPGLASRLGPTVAFGEGVQAAHDLTGQDQVNVSFLSLGDGDQIADLAAILPDTRPDTRLDAVYLTNATCWSPHHPTITTGTRGRLVVQLTLRSGAGFDDFLGSGALRNPLSKLTQLVASLRDERGRISLPGFYDRAHAPDDGARSALTTDGHNPDAWAEHVGVARFAGRLSSLERAALWPGVSLIDIATDTHDGSRSPSTVTATVAFYLVPDQRHSEVEASVRSWFQQAAPSELHPSFRTVASTRPFCAEPESLPVAAQARAAYRVHGRHPVLIPAGGAPGSGELAFIVGAPVGFAGVSPPSQSFGTWAESLPWAQFDAAVALASETCLQLRRA